MNFFVLHYGFITSQWPKGITRALERGVPCRVSRSNILQFRVSTWKSQCRVSTWYNYYIFCIFPSCARWVSSVGVNFECRCRACFCLNVGCQMKNFGNVGCQNNPFHGPYHSLYFCFFSVLFSLWHAAVNELFPPMLLGRLDFIITFPGDKAKNPLSGSVDHKIYCNCPNGPANKFWVNS